MEKILRHDGKPIAWSEVSDVNLLIVRGIKYDVERLIELRGSYDFDVSLEHTITGGKWQATSLIYDAVGFENGCVIFEIECEPHPL